MSWTPFSGSDMKPWIRALPEMLLVAAAACLLVLVVVPAPRTASAPERQRPSARSASAPPAAASSPLPAEPDAIVSLFYREPPRKTPAPPGIPAETEPSAPEPVKPVEAPWLSYVGYFSGADGRPFFYVKDARSGRLIKIATGEASDWTLVEAAEDRIVVRNEGTVYTVPRKR
jgi:hypothetical protein